MLRPPTDEALAARVNRGDAAAFAVLHVRYRAEMERYARRFLGDHALAEDVVQDAFVRTYRELAGGRELLVRAWLYELVRNRALDELRRKRHHHLALDPRLPAADRWDPSVVAEDDVALREVLDGIAHLPPRQRTALVLHAVHGLAHDEVARDLGISAAASRALVHRARGTLAPV